MPPHKGIVGLRWCYRCSCGPNEECRYRKKKKEVIIFKPEVQLTKEEEELLKVKILESFYYNKIEDK